MPQLSDFKVGDVWETPGGDLLKIVDVDPTSPYPVVTRRVTSVADHKMTYCHLADGSAWHPQYPSEQWALVRKVTPKPKEVWLVLNDDGLVKVYDCEQDLTCCYWVVAQARVTPNWVKRHG